MNTTARNEDAAVALQYEMTTIIREEVGMPELDASQMAEAVIRGLRKRFAGQYLGDYYLARGMTLRERAARDRAIRQEFDGTNLDAVCKRHKVSKARLYQIIGRR